MKNRRFVPRNYLAVVGALLVAPAFTQAASYKFQTINNNTDPNFNQLLGINTAGTIAGYYGDGMGTVANNGYTVVPPYGQSNFTIENVPGAAQTQVTGLNNGGVTVGFSVDAAGTNTGFVHTGSTFTTPVTDPNTPPTAGSMNQLLGVNDKSLAAGFYLTANGANQGYVYNIATKSFTAVSPAGSTASVATGINNAGAISGFATIGGNTEGFYINGSKTIDFEAPGSTNTMFFGLNNAGLVVGSYVDANGLTNGLVYNTANGSYYTVNDPKASATPAFTFTGTTINGINDLGQLVGFYSDGTNVNGLLASPTPEPASLGFMGLSLVLGLGLCWKARRKQV